MRARKRVSRLTITQTLGTRLRSSVGRSVVGSLAASGGLQLIVIVSGVLVARSLGPEDRGYLALLVVVSGVFALAGTLGLPSAVTYYIARDPADARQIAASLAWVGVLQVGAVFVLQAAALAALVASDPPHVQVAAAISLLLPPGILALSFGVAILQGQRRFTAFNLLRILPSTAYVVGVVIVYTLNATSLVMFMALWAAVNLIGGFLRSRRRPPWAPQARRGGAWPVAGADGEVRAQGSAGEPVPGRRGPPRSGCRRPLPDPGGARLLRGWPGVLAPASCSRLERRDGRVSAGRRRPGSPLGTTRHVEILLPRARVVGVGRRGARAHGGRAHLSLVRGRLQRSDHDRADPPHRVPLHGRPTCSHRRGQRPRLSGLRDDRRGHIVDPAPPRRGDSPSVVRSRGCRTGARGLVGSEPPAARDLCARGRPPRRGPAGETGGGIAPSGRVPTTTSGPAGIHRRGRRTPRRAGRTGCCIRSSARCRHGCRALGLAPVRLRAESAQRAPSITPAARSRSSRLAASRSSGRGRGGRRIRCFAPPLLRRGSPARPCDPPGVRAGHPLGPSLPRQLPTRLRRARGPDVAECR